MATHSSILAWRIPWTEEPGGLQSIGSQRVRHNFMANTHNDFNEGLPWWFSGKESTCPHRRHRLDPWVGKIPWRRKWQPTPVFLPGEFHGQRSLADYSAWGRKESDKTEQLTHTDTKFWYIFPFLLFSK